MKLYKYLNKNNKSVILTPQKDGANLPGWIDGWTCQKLIDVENGDPPRIGASSEEILAGVKDNGYFKWPDGKD